MRLIKRIIAGISLALSFSTLAFANSEGQTSVHMSVPASPEMIDELVPQTGDTTSFLPYVIILALGLGVLLLLFFLRKKKGEDK